jgi:hypothetical protein
MTFMALSFLGGSHLAGPLAIVAVLGREPLLAADQLRPRLIVRHVSSVRNQEDPDSIASADR